MNDFDYDCYQKKVTARSAKKQGSSEERLHAAEQLSD